MKSTTLFSQTNRYIQSTCLVTLYQSYKSYSPESLTNVWEVARRTHKRS